MQRNRIERERQILTCALRISVIRSPVLLRTARSMGPVLNVVVKDCGTLSIFSHAGNLR
jgi:hypothetical protein